MSDELKNVGRRLRRRSMRAAQSDVQVSALEGVEAQSLGFVYGRSMVDVSCACHVRGP